MVNQSSKLRHIWMASNKHKIGLAVNDTGEAAW